MSRNVRRNCFEDLAESPNLGEFCRTGGEGVSHYFREISDFQGPGSRGGHPAVPIGGSPDAQGPRARAGESRRRPANRDAGSDTAAGCLTGRNAANLLPNICNPRRSRAAPTASSPRASGAGSPESPLDLTARHEVRRDFAVPTGKTPRHSHTKPVKYSNKIQSASFLQLAA